MLCFTEVNIFFLTKDQASNEAPGLSVVRGKFHPWASHPMSSMSRRAALKPVCPCSPGALHAITALTSILTWSW